MVKEYITKDSGKREQFSSGMQRDSQVGKPRFDLIFPLNQKYEDTLFYRWAKLMGRGAEKYDDRNWEMVNSVEELDRVKASCWRHFTQAMLGENDEDHFAAILFNLNQIDFLMNKLNVDINGNKLE